MRWIVAGVGAKFNLDAFWRWTGLRILRAFPEFGDGNDATLYVRAMWRVTVSVGSAAPSTATSKMRKTACLGL